MHSSITRSIYFGLQRLRGEPITGALADVRRTEFISRDELLSIQARRQLEQLRFALHQVPVYRRSFAPFASRIGSELSWEDLNDLMNSLPVIEKGTLVEHPQEFTSSDAASRHTYPDKTSGSSGTPLTFPCDQIAWAYRHALYFRCLESFGVNVGEPYALFFGLHWNKRARLQVRLRDLVFNRARVSAYDVGPEQVDRHLRTIVRNRPTHFLGYPSAIYDFCLLLQDRGRDLRHLELKGVFLTAEPLRPHQRKTIEEITGSRCIDTYGSAEGGFTAFECPDGSLHLAAETVSLQLREPHASSGEAVVTDMMLRAFPLIRYAIGDEVVLRPGRCTCGRPHPMLHSIEGRAGEPIILPNGRRINPNLPSYIFKSISGQGVIRKYRFVETPDAKLNLYLVVNQGFREAHLSIVKQETFKALGIDIPLVVHVVDALPHLPNAKHRDYVRASQSE